MNLYFCFTQKELPNVLLQNIRTLEKVLFLFHMLKTITKPQAPPHCNIAQVFISLLSFYDLFTFLFFFCLNLFHFVHSFFLYSYQVQNYKYSDSHRGDWETISVLS